VEQEREEVSTRFSFSLKGRASLPVLAGDPNKFFMPFQTVGSQLVGVFDDEGSESCCW